MKLVGLLVYRCKDYLHAVVCHRFQQQFPHVMGSMPCKLDVFSTCVEHTPVSLNQAEHNYFNRIWTDCIIFSEGFISLYKRGQLEHKNTNWDNFFKVDK